MTEFLTAGRPLRRQSAVALGFFDGVHRGHRAVLREAVSCAAAQELVPCAFTFAADSVPVKQGTAISYLYTDEQKRALMEPCGIRFLYCPSFAALRELDGTTFCRQILVELFHAKDVFCGGDFRFGKHAAWDFAALCRLGSEMGFRVHRVEPVLCGGEKISSSMIRQALLHGRPEYAAQLLGISYYVSGSVVHGAALGRTRAVPTINIPFASGQLVPQHGVYVSRTHTAQGVWDSITNIGIKPTVSDAGTPGAETFLLDFSGDLYEQPCRVELLHFMRAEQKFPDVEALYRQIAQDQKNCREWLQEKKMR